MLFLDILAEKQDKKITKTIKEFLNQEGFSRQVKNI